MSKSKAAQLETLLDGKWRYEWPCYWRCDDGLRYVARVHTGGYDVNGETAPGHGYFLYGPSGESLGRVYLD